jgi:uncharacterized protein YdeI (YjbR/CyaY-like superfamily)
MDSSARGPLGMPEEAVVEATGRSSAAWFALLDAWRAQTKGHVARVEHLQEIYGLPERWANTVAIRYEAARDLEEESSVPADLISAMILKASARVRFEGLTPAEQRSIVQWIEAADGQNERRARIQQTVAELITG